MRAMWERFGKPGGRAPGMSIIPTRSPMPRRCWRALRVTAAFADDFFARFIQGHEVVNYARLLSNAGLVLRPRAPQAGFAGELRLQDAQGGVRIAGAVLVGSPAYEAGLERDDVIIAVDSASATRAEGVDAAIRAARPGASLDVTYLRRNQRVRSTIHVIADPRVEVIPAEQAGQPLTDAQRRFRDAWLRSAAGNTF